MLAICVHACIAIDYRGTLRNPGLETPIVYVERCGPIDHMQLRAYLIRNRAPHVINSHVHQAVAILSGKKNKVMRQSYVLLVVRHDFNICINRQLLEEAGVQFLWNVNVHG